MEREFREQSVWPKIFGPLGLLISMSMLCVGIVVMPYTDQFAFLVKWNIVGLVLFVISCNLEEIWDWITDLWWRTKCSIGACIWGS